METVATVVEVVGILFICSLSLFFFGSAIRQSWHGWRKHWEARRYWQSTRTGRTGL